MATLSGLADKLEKRFTGVPNVKREDVEGWIERSMLEHGYEEPSAEVSNEDKLLVLLYAEWDGTLQLALRTAYYFDYTDAEESVDKRAVSEQYRSVATELKDRYDKAKQESGQSVKSSFTIATRVDR